MDGLNGVALPMFGHAFLHGDLVGGVRVVVGLEVYILVQGHLHDVLFRVEDGVDAFVAFQRRVEERAGTQGHDADAQQGARGEQATARSGARGGGAAGEGFHR